MRKIQYYYDIKTKQDVVDYCLENSCYDCRFQKNCFDKNILSKSVENRLEMIKSYVRKKKLERLLK